MIIVGRALCYGIQSANTNKVGILAGFGPDFSQCDRIKPDSTICHPATVLHWWVSLRPPALWQPHDGSILVTEKTLYLKFICCTGEMTDDVSSFCSLADKFIIYRLALAGKSRVSSYTSLSVPSSCLSFSLPPLLHLYFLPVLRNNLQPVCIRTDNTSPFRKFQLIPADLCTTNNYKKVSGVQGGKKLFMQLQIVSEIR